LGCDIFGVTLNPIKKGYKYQSRHEHAKRRVRGPGGRFASKNELENLKAQSTDDSYESRSPSRFYEDF